MSIRCYTSGSTVRFIPVVHYGARRTRSTERPESERVDPAGVSGSRELLRSTAQCEQLYYVFVAAKARPA